MIPKLFQRHWTCWKIFMSCNKPPKLFWNNFRQIISVGTSTKEGWNIFEIILFHMWPRHKWRRRWCCLCCSRWARLSRCRHRQQSSRITSIYKCSTATRKTRVRLIPTRQLTPSPSDTPIPTPSPHHHRISGSSSGSSSTEENQRTIS